MATQKEELRNRFKGIPEHVVNFFIYIAEEIRQIMSIIGVSTMEELIGNKEFLKIREVTLPKTNNIDLSSLIEISDRNDDRSWIKHPKNAHDNGKVLEDKLLHDPAFISAIKNHNSIDKNLKIINTDRSVCAKISGEIAELHGNNGFKGCLLYTSPSPRDLRASRMPSSA